LILGLVTHLQQHGKRAALRRLRRSCQLCKEGGKLVRIPAVSLLTAWATNVQVELFLALDWQMEPRDKLVSSAHPLDWWRLVELQRSRFLGAL
jgi:hypothetical protein